MSFVRSSVEFERRCEFTNLRDWPKTHHRCTKINKSPTDSNGVRASSLDIWTANLAQSLTVGNLTNSRSFIFGDSNWKFCKVGYPVDPQNLTFRCGHFRLGISFFYAFIFSETNHNLLDIQEHCIRKLRKIRSELKLLSGVYYWFLKLYTRIIWHSYFPLQGIS